ncbi:MAG TPA: class I SAM-dependent methyltransferase [Pyrinomonadaceae bacterium]
MNASRDVSTFRPTDRFSDRVENYIKYRPGYPAGVLALMREEMALTPSSVVADIGSGTGLLTRMFLQNGNAVYGVEPNREMREAGERLLEEFPSFKSVEGTAEATNLDGASVDFVTAGQAFHWFDVPRARREFQRILRPGGRVVLVWNNRAASPTPFLADYERLLVEFGNDYQQVSAGYAHEESLRALFTGGYEQKVFDNRQLLNHESLRGRLLSCSYVPLEADPRHGPMLERLREIFDAHQRDGRVSMDYDTQIFYGVISDE